MTPFLGSKSKNFLSGAGFGPKPTSGPNFIKIGVGDRTGPYIRVSRSLIYGLFKTTKIRTGNDGKGLGARPAPGSSEPAWVIGKG